MSRDISLMPLPELRGKGFEILVRELGPANALRFLGLYHAGVVFQICASWVAQLKMSQRERVSSFSSAEAHQCLGIGKRTQINRWNSGSESCTGVGVVAGFSGPVGMLNSPHVQMAEIVLKKEYLHIL